MKTEASERRNTTHPPDWWEAWEREAFLRGRTLAEWMGEMCNRGLTREVRQQLSKRGKRGRPTKDNGVQD